MEKEYQRSCSELNDCHYELNGKNNEIQQLNNEMKLIIFNTKELQSANDRLKNLVEQSDRKIK
jgi:prefoldin subunit 5